MSGSTAKATSASRQFIVSSTIMMPSEREDVAEDGDDAGGEHVVDHVDVGRHARHQPADRIAVEELQIEALQVLVDLHAQVEHDALPGHLQRPRLDVFERERGDENGEVTPAAIR